MAPKSITIFETIRAIKAVKITDGLNLLIRPLYADTDPICPSNTGVRPTVPHDPVIFPCSAYRIVRPVAAIMDHRRKKIYHQSLKCLRIQWTQVAGQNDLAYRMSTNFKAIFSVMRPLLSILVLQLCLFTIRADELPVIKDSEAVKYVGKTVEVRGLVVSVITSPLGTALINFGREYPNQTFAGFIAAGSKMASDQRIAMLQGKIIGITGTIELYLGKPEIKVTSADQIKGSNSQLGQ